ncbi:MAG: CCA tRNA nucleotidyltransferase [archaeon]|nr:CCA tRNA nucleotidyltransferase [archaeon]
MSVESDVMARIIPDKDTVDWIDGVARRLKEKVQEYIDAHGIVAELKLVGSYSKGTYLSNPDLDLFIMFPVGTSREELVETGLKIGEEVLHGSRMYAEHPYTSAVFEGVDVDLVPNIHIQSTENLVTAVDRTPFHTDYVLSKMAEGQNNQIRLLKRFMKGIGAYGAEPNVRGFSGYLCELMVLKYGTFLDTLRAASETWREGTQVSLEPPRRKLEGPLVFYDPVDGNRNVASAVHVDTLARFVQASREYLANPS